jgi:hypothetical protein
MEVSGQLYAPAALAPGKEPLVPIGQEAKWAPDLLTKYTLTFSITRCCPLQRVMTSKLTRLTHKIAIQPYLVAKSCTICSSRSRLPVRKLLDTPSYLERFCKTMKRVSWGSDPKLNSRIGRSQSLNRDIQMLTHGEINNTM